MKNLSGIQQPKGVKVTDENGNVIGKYSSLRNCAAAERIPVTSLYNAIKNNKPLNGYKYEYI